MRNVSAPCGDIDWSHPNLAPTYWRTVIDDTRKVNYFEFTLSPNIVWIDLNEIDFSPGSGIRDAAVKTDYSLMGSINKALKPTKPSGYLHS